MPVYFSPPPSLLDAYTQVKYILNQKVYLMEPEKDLLKTMHILLNKLSGFIWFEK